MKSEEVVSTVKRGQPIPDGTRSMEFTIFNIIAYKSMCYDGKSYLIEESCQSIPDVTQLQEYVYLTKTLIYNTSQAN